MHGRRTRLERLSGPMHEVAETGPRRRVQRSVLSTHSA